MNAIPIIFAIDNNVVMQCGVTITSLLLNAKPETYYEIYILCNQSQLNIESREALLRAFENERQCKIAFVDVGESFGETEEMVTGHVTLATYYRLLIPVLFPQFDKVIYADIDMIFQQDLSELYQTSLQNGELLAAALDLAIDDKHFFHSDLPSKIGKTVKDYFNAGFLVMNLKQMREENLAEEFNRHAKIQYDQNDQDVLNVITCGEERKVRSVLKRNSKKRLSIILVFTNHGTLWSVWHMTLGGIITRCRRSMTMRCILKGSMTRLRLVAMIIITSRQNN